MKIGFVGAGYIGGTLAKRLVALGHDVLVSNSRGPETLADFAKESGAKAVTTLEAVRGRDIVVVTIPIKDVPKLKGLLKGVGPDTVIVDTCNYYPRQRDGRIAGIEGGATEARWVSEQIGRPVVKAFNNINWTRLADQHKPAGDPARIAIPVAGDEPAAKQKVMALIDELGFDPVDAGGIDESWRQQPGQPCYGADLGKAKLPAALAEANLKRSPDFSV